MKKINIFLVFILSFATTFAQIADYSEFQKSDFFQFFNLKEGKREKQKIFLKTEAFQEFIDIEVDIDPTDAIEEMHLKVSREFIDGTYRTLAFDIINSFIQLHQPEGPLAKILEYYRTRDQSLVNHPMNCFFKTYSGKIPFYVCNHKGVSLRMIHEEKILGQNSDKPAYHLIAKKCKLPPRDLNVSHKFLNNKEIAILDKGLKKIQSNDSVQVWQNSNDSKYFRIVEISQKHNSENEAIEALFCEFYKFFENGKLFAPKECEKFGKVCMMSEFPDIFGGNSKNLIIVFVKQSRILKLFISGNSELQFQDVISLAEKIYNNIQEK